jgi:hypothetical protein
MTLPRTQAVNGSPAPAPPWAGAARTAAGRPERVWEMRQALGRRLAAMRSQAGFSQWEFAPLTGYSRSTLSDAELGRHRLRREFWVRCDAALLAKGALVAAYDRIESTAAAMRRTARSQAQAAREEQATERLQALLPVTGPALPVTGPASPAGEAGPDAPGDSLPAGARVAVEPCPHCGQPVRIVIMAARAPEDLPGL